MYYNITIEV